MSSWMPLVLITLFATFAVGLPLVRTAVVHRRFAVVLSDDPVRSVMVAALLVALGVGIVASAALAVLGPEAIGVWELPAPVAWVGTGLGLASVAFVVLAQAQMGASWRIGITSEETALVTGGLYRWVRHPIYTGLLGALVALVLIAPSPWTVLAVGWLWSLVAIQARLEERHLAGQHPEEFGAWAARTGRFFPGIGRIAL